MELTVVLPCLNEAENIAHTVRDLESWFESANIDGSIVIVDDGSTDAMQTVAAALSETFPKVSVITHKKNMGVGVALRNGCDAVTTHYIAYMDSDGQFKAREFDLLLPQLSSHRIAAGYRVRRADPFFRKVNAWLYGRLVRYVLGVKKRDINCALVVFERSLWPSIRPTYATGALFCAEMYMAVQRQGISIAQVGVPHYPRMAGTSTGANPFVIFTMFRDLLKLKRDVGRQ